MVNPFRLLIKYATRERPSQFVQTLFLYRKLCDDWANTRILVTVDTDDRTMWDTWKKDPPLRWPDTGEPVEMNQHPRRGKISAINYGMENSGDWDIVLCASDDMLPQVQGYDNAIRTAMNAHFPNLDGALWWHDGRQQREGNPNYINTIQCLGRKEFERLGGYIYHPSYRSLWCDNEATEVGMRDGTLVEINRCIIKNFSPDHSNELGTLPRDRMYQRNNSYYRLDHKNYKARKAKGFPI